MVLDSDSKTRTIKNMVTDSKSRNSTMKIRFLDLVLRTKTRTMKIWPIHTKNDNYKDNYKKSFSILKNIRVHTSAIAIKAQRNDIVGITFRTIFFQLMNDTNIDTQSESILLSRAWECKAADAHALRINRRYRLLVWMLISLSYSYLYSYPSWCERALRLELKDQDHENTILDSVLKTKTMKIWSWTLSRGPRP